MMITILALLALIAGCASLAAARSVAGQQFVASMRSDTARIPLPRHDPAAPRRRFRMAPSR